MQQENSVLKASKELLRNRDIVCFSNDWDGDPLSKTHIMRILSRDHRILWVNSLGNRSPTMSVYDAKRIYKKVRSAFSGLVEVEPNIHVLAPLVFPVFGKPWVRRCNQMALEMQLKRAMQKLRFRDWVIWSFLPAAEWVVGRLRPEFLVYHCVDEFSAFSDAPSKEIAETEARLVRAADLVIVSAERLVHSKRPMNPKTVLVRHGVDRSHFAKALDPLTIVPQDIGFLPKPVFGFFGLIADWVDTELIEKIADSFPDASIVLIGKIRTDIESCCRHQNIHFLGPRRYEDLPAYAKAFDVALLPFRCNELTLNSNPLKVREYLAAGLPVVSTAIPEVERIEWCRIAKDHNEFIDLLRQELCSTADARERSRAMVSESWEARVEEIRNVIEKAYGEKMT